MKRCLERSLSAVKVKSQKNFLIDFFRISGTLPKQHYLSYTKFFAISKDHVSEMVYLKLVLGYFRTVFLFISFYYEHR